MNDHYQALYSSFRWLVPNAFNIAEACCHRWAASSPDARRIAVYHEDPAGNREVWTFARLAEAANRLANGLVRTGVGRGDRVALALAAGPEAVAAHMAVYSLGAVAVPLPVRLDAQAMERRLYDAEARVAIVDPAGGPALLAALERCPALRLVIGVDLDDERVLPWRSLLARQSAQFRPASTRAAEPAMLLYSSDPGIAPRGVVLSHAALIGALPGFVASQNWFPQPGDIFWSPADWAESAGLLGGLLPTLYFGHAVVAAAGDLPGNACSVLERYQVTNALLTAAQLEAVMRAEPDPRRRLALRALACLGGGPETDVFAWCREVLDVTPNAVFGPPEAGLAAGDSQARWPARPGSLGRPYPGHQVAVLDTLGRPLPPGKLGEIAVNRHDIHGHPDPALFLGYWRDDDATRARHSGDWFRTGELARLDADGYLWHAGPVQAAAPQETPAAPPDILPPAASGPAHAASPAAAAAAPLPQAAPRP